MDLGVKGGFEYLGKYYHRNPLNIIFNSDIEPSACLMHDEYFKSKSVVEDINNISYKDIPPTHVILGGFPCESFSIVAQNPPRLGYKNEQGKLFFEMVRIIEGRKPLVIIAENVKGILSANKRQAFPLILEAFENIGYHIKWDILNASHFGVPQKRERVFIVGFRKKLLCENFSFPEPVTLNSPTPLKEVIFSENQVPKNYFFSQRAVKGMKKVRKKMNKGREQNIEKPCNTVSAHLAKVSLNSTDPVLKINGKYRRFMPKEVARIQSFPEDYQINGSDSKVYHALGDAVPPVLMWHLTKQIVKTIRKTDKRIFNSKPYSSAAEKRSYNMSRIKGKNTSIEVLLRKQLWARGLRYRTNYNKLPGKPDIVFESKKIAVFCDSEFWHGKNFDKDIKRIKTNKNYWQEKIRKNIKRDKEVDSKLKEMGWSVLRFWQQDIEEKRDEIVNLIIKSLKRV